MIAIQLLIWGNSYIPLELGVWSFQQMQDTSFTAINVWNVVYKLTTKIISEVWKFDIIPNKWNNICNEIVKSFQEENGGNNSDDMNENNHGRRSSSSRNISNR